jgi:hypothetical protein
MTFDPFKKPDPKPWEEKRAQVKAHAEAMENDLALSLERRIIVLERETRETRSAVESAREVISRFNTLMDQLVTREHLQTVRMKVNGLLILAAFGLLYFVFGGR